ncbi:MAG: sigma-70 family RNA polymerase sigma factor [Acetobacteraceae bacterium]
MTQAALHSRDAIASDPAEWAALMALTQGGDGAAYRTLLIGITPYLRAIASRAHRNPSDAEDTVQDVLLTLHAVRHTYDAARPFKPWLAGIARHRVMDRLRALGRASAREVALELEHEAFPAAETSETLGFEVKDLHAAIGSLPPGQRQAVTLLKLQENSLKQAAAVSGMSVGALKVATHRGIAALRASLHKRGGKE